MFYQNISGWHVRYLPSLSLELLKPDSECVWYAPWDETRTVGLQLNGRHGINYCRVKTRVFVADLYNHRDQISANEQFVINMSLVNYNDPE